MAKEPHKKTNAELAQDLSTRPDSLVHLTARAEMARRAAVQNQWRSWIMLASAVIAALAAAASACSAYFQFQTLKGVNMKTVELYARVPHALPIPGIIRPPPPNPLPSNP